MLVLLVISAAAAFLSWLIPLKLPTVAYCSILGLLCACPISPISEFVIQSVGQINFTAPLTMAEVQLALAPVVHRADDPRQGEAQETEGQGLGRIQPAWGSWDWRRALCAPCPARGGRWW